jgi:hypothetical protein
VAEHRQRGALDAGDDPRRPRRPERHQRRVVRRGRAHRGPARPHRERRQRRGRLLLLGRPDLAVRRHDRRGGGWSPDVVKGSDYGFVVAGHTRDQYVAYTSTGTGTKWLPTGSLGSTSSGPGFTPAVGPGGRVIAAGSTNSTRTNQQGLLIKADTAGTPAARLAELHPGRPRPRADGERRRRGGERAGRRGQRQRLPRGVAAGVGRALDPGLLADPGVRGYRSGRTVRRDPRAHGCLAVGPGPLVLTSSDGTTWRSSSGITHDLAGVSAVQAASGPHGYVITGTVAEPAARTRGTSGGRRTWSPGPRRAT